MGRQFGARILGSVADKITLNFTSGKVKDLFSQTRPSQGLAEGFYKNSPVHILSFLFGSGYLDDLEVHAMYFLVFSAFFCDGGLAGGGGGGVYYQRACATGSHCTGKTGIMAKNIFSQGKVQSTGTLEIGI